MIPLDGRTLTPAGIADLAAGRDRAEVPPEARERAAASAAFAEEAAAQRVIYGRSTGVGANRDVLVLDNPQAHALALLRSHATAHGPLRSAERVRALLAVRANQLAAGGSGAAPEVLDGLARMLELNALPPVRELGSIGTGDLPALAVTGLALIGEVTVTPRLAPITLGVGDVLPLMSSNAATLGDAALAVVAWRRLTEAALVVAALTCTAVTGNPEAFAPAVEAVTPFAGARRVCAVMRGLVGGSVGARLQDPFGLRALPQVHGAALDRIAAADQVVTAMVNAPSENPVLLPAVGVAHHGGFHAAYLSQALDAAAVALAQTAALSLARVTMFNEPAFTGVAPFLGDGTPGASGVMVVEYVAASALAVLREAAAPVSVQTVTLSRGVEEHASFASLAAANALHSVEQYRTLLACELLAAVRCLRQRGLSLPPSLAAAAPLLAPLGRDFADRDLTPELDAAAGVLGDLAPFAAV